MDSLGRHGRSVVAVLCDGSLTVRNTTRTILGKHFPAYTCHTVRMLCNAFNARPWDISYRGVSIVVADGFVHVHIVSITPGAPQRKLQ